MNEVASAVAVAGLPTWAFQSLFMTALTIVGGVGVAVVRSRNAGAKSHEAGANAETANTEAAQKLYEHYGKEIEQLRNDYRDISVRLTNMATELAAVKGDYKASAFNERKYRGAFSEQLHIYTDLAHHSRGKVDPQEMARIDGRQTNLMMKLASYTETVE